MSGYLGQGGSATSMIFEDPPAPRNGHDLVRQQGAEAVRRAMPDEHRRSFDRAHPYTPVVAASYRLDDLNTQMAGYGRNIPHWLTTEAYAAAQRSQELLDGYDRGLGRFVDQSQVHYADGSRARLLDYLTNQLAVHNTRELLGQYATVHGQGRGGGQRARVTLGDPTG
ncbi:hypothetical protein [Micromonospora sp. NBC_01813]|uniref:hypothetical protein n=1 Tax=Micromonospora sp. NBC_01813 TaxID=2975988 RepID=UPI002DDBBB6B|nr:hypothetical protein [Micromonospora sp. NBC_01813]WSA08145.1 hypothetical protein OG958_28710 [Micromonospora sp. NBC_01813]